MRPRGVISIGGDITEIIYALGKIDQVIGRDTTSFYPPSVTSLPDIGYVRQLGAEGLLSLSPDLIIASSESGPPEVVEQGLILDNENCYHSHLMSIVIYFFRELTSEYEKKPH